MTATQYDDSRALLADHAARLKSLEEQSREDRQEIRSLKNWIMGTLASVAVGLLLQVITLIKK